MLNLKIDTDDYTIIKKECEVELNRLEAKLSNYASNPVKIEELLSKAVGIMANISVWFQNADNERKRAIIDSMYPEKLSFDGDVHRTTILNEVVEKISLISSALGSKKRRASTDRSALPTWVRPPGLEPGTKRL